MGPGPDAESSPSVVVSEFCVVARRSDSLGARGRRRVFATLAGVSLTVAAACALQGAWPVLPYSVIEVALVGLAFVVVERRAKEWERLTVVRDRVVVERRHGGRLERREFNRPWLSVELADATKGAPRIVLRYAGEAMDFGASLPAAQRGAVAKELKRLCAR